MIKIYLSEKYSAEMEFYKIDPCCGPGRAEVGGAEPQAVNDEVQVLGADGIRVRQRPLQVERVWDNCRGPML
jgi:hypothetical protein